MSISSIDRTRRELGLPQASQPAAILDHRFHQHVDKLSICDNCDCYCTGRARDWLPGSFVYCSDNTLAGPPKSRKECFAKLRERETPWRNDSWNAKFLCRPCLVQQWQKKPWEINDWLTLRHPGACKAASIQRRLWANSGSSGWQNSWSGYRHDYWWKGNQRDWRHLGVTQPHVARYATLDQCRE